jgi:hypothetical protein
MYYQLDNNNDYQLAPTVTILLILIKTNFIIFFRQASSTVCTIESHVAGSMKSGFFRSLLPKQEKSAKIVYFLDLGKFLS